MKIHISVILLQLIFCSTSVKAQAIIQFDTTIYDFGTITQSSERLTAKYWFTNVGNEPLIIDRVQTSGGGLATKELPKDAIMPGKCGMISLLYPVLFMNLILKLF